MFLSIAQKQGNINNSSDFIRKGKKMNKKVFGYPKFSKNGVQTLTTYDNEYRDMKMDIRVYRISAGESRKFSREKEESAFLLLSGKIKFICGENEWKASRKDVFSEGPWALHVCTGTSV